MHQRQKTGYLIAVGGTAIAAALRYAADGVLAEAGPMLLFVFPVLAAAGYGGLYPGLAATALSVAVATVLFAHPSDASRLSLFAVLGFALSLGAEWLIRAREQVRLSEERLRLALEAGALAAWQLDAQRMELHSSPLCRVNYGLEPGERLDYERLIGELVHEEDREALRAAVRAAIESHSDMRLEYRSVSPQGTLQWLDTRARAFRDASGGVKLMGITANITERKRAEALRQESERTLQEADRRKDEFLAILAHELRNPLQPLRLCGDLLGVHEKSLPTLHTARSIIGRQVDVLSRLVEDLVDLARIRNNTLELRPARALLNDLLDAAAQTSRPKIDEARQSLVVSLPDEPLYLTCDATRMTQVFCNLLNNAARHAGPGCTVRMCATCTPAEIHVSVQDDGVGIAQEGVARLFDLFYRAGDGEDRRAGLGLGLTLVKRLVELHGGTVEGASDGPSRGSRFTVRLPRRDEDMMPVETLRAANG